MTFFYKKSTVAVLPVQTSYQGVGVNNPEPQGKDPKTSKTYSVAISEITTTESRGGDVTTPVEQPPSLPNTSLLVTPVPNENTGPEKRSQRGTIPSPPQ